MEFLVVLIVLVIVMLLLLVILVERLVIWVVLFFSMIVLFMFVRLRFWCGSVVFVDVSLIVLLSLGEVSVLLVDILKFVFFERVIFWLVIKGCVSVSGVEFCMWMLRFCLFCSLM